MVSLYPDRETYTRTVGPWLESAGVTLLFGAVIVMAAHRAWPAGVNEILGVYLSPEFLWDPALFLAVCALLFVPSVVWLALHPLIDARRIDRNPTLANHIVRHYPGLFKEAVALHAMAFTASAAAGMYLFHAVAPTFRMPAALAVYGFTHGLFHWIRNRMGAGFPMRCSHNLQMHLFGLLMHDPARFELSARILGAVWAFQQGTAHRLNAILLGHDRVPALELLQDLDTVVHDFPPGTGIESMLKVAAPEARADYLPVVNELLAVLAAKTSLERTAVPAEDPSLLLMRAPRDRPLRLVCACLHNYNRSPAMAAVLQHLLHREGLTPKVTVVSGGIAPIAKPNLQLVAILHARGIRAEPHHPQPVSDADLAEASLVLASDILTALALGWRIQQLDPDPLAPRKVLLFTALDRLRFGSQSRLPDPATDSITLRESVDQILQTMEHALLPLIVAATFPPALLVLAGRLLRGLFPGDLPPDVVEKRLRLVLAIARQDPRYLIHIDRRTFTTSRLSLADVRFVWDEAHRFNETFLALLCARFAERDPIRNASPYGKDYANSAMALASWLSPVVHHLGRYRSNPRHTN